MLKFRFEYVISHSTVTENEFHDQFQIEFVDTLNMILLSIKIVC